MFSQDPLHCYALEQARTRGLFGIEGLYEAPYEDDTSVLYVSIRGELGLDLYRYMREQSYAFYESWPDLVTFEKYGSRCIEAYKNNPEEFPRCYLETTGGGMRDHILPRPSAYEYVMFVGGGEKGRQKVRGWASWRLLWPRVAAQGGSGARDASGGPAFDVSDVDVTSFPEIDESTCRRPEIISDGCSLHLRFPDVGIAGSHDRADPSTVYYQIKDPPTDPAEGEGPEGPAVSVP